MPQYHNLIDPNLNAADGLWVPAEFEATERQLVRSDVVVAIELMFSKLLFLAHFLRLPETAHLFVRVVLDHVRLVHLQGLRQLREPLRLETYHAHIRANFLTVILLMVLLYKNLRKDVFI